VPPTSEPALLPPTAWSFTASRRAPIQPVRSLEPHVRLCEVPPVNACDLREPLHSCATSITGCTARTARSKTAVILELVQVLSRFAWPVGSSGQSGYDPPHPLPGCPAAERDVGGAAPEQDAGAAVILEDVASTDEASTVDARSHGPGTVWIAGQHLLVAQALAAALARHVRPVKASRWVTDSASVTEADPARDLVVVLDDLDPPTSVASVQEQLAQHPSRAVLMTGLPKCHVWGGWLGAGVADVIAEPGSVEELAEVLADLRTGEARLVSEEERRDLADAWERHVAEEDEALRRLGTLSQRELAVLTALADGRPSPDIAASLGISTSTVRTHIRSILRKLDVNTQLRAAVMVYRLETSVRIHASQLVDTQNW
jgi:DNA-binding NarL/FixJ family response regulator